ncbi:transposase [Methylocaldum marinum]|jgi:transposase|uniref:Transposase n=1 Tax=Methylocaldum marinum TaxID=1432792 RepID=A0A250KVR8_9GAMM|nr:helix-turn-helix domain-containing protein [Methylocaldum marinum]BBA35768.1 transposase [Methylocaldum marinum]
MPQKIYLGRLGDAEREHWEQLLRGGRTTTRHVTRARILLEAAEGWTDERIAEALSVGRATIERTRRRFVECNLEALKKRPRPGQ